MYDLIKWLITITKKVLPPLFLSTLCRIADQLLGIALYIISIWSIINIFVQNYFSEPISKGYILKTILVLIVCALLKAFLRYGEQFFGHYVAFKSLELLRRELFAKLWPQAPAVMYKANSGDLLAIATKDIDRIEVFFAHTFAPAVSAIIVPFVVLITGIFYTNLTVVALAFIFVFLSLVIIPLYTQKQIIDLQSEYISKRGILAAHVTDSLQGLNEIVGYGAEENRLKETDKLQDDIYSSITFTNTIFASRRAINNFLWCIQVPILFITGIYTAVNPIYLLLFIIAIVRLNEVLRGVEAFSTDLNASLVCAKRLYDVCKTEPIVNNSGQNLSESNSYSIKVQDLFFTYPNASKPVLKNINVEFKENTWSCIVGATGSGKSTLISLIQRFFDPTDGMIFINGQDISNVNVDSIRKTVSLVTQNTYLFNDTIANNLRLAKPDATDEELWFALKVACLDEEVSSFFDGIDTLVGEKGKSLSGGQIQRLCLARAILLEAKVLILDEFTAHLNVELEEKVRNSIRKNIPNITVIEITHRLDAINEANQVIVIDNGCVVEQGSPSDLLASNGALSAFMRRKN